MGVRDRLKHAYNALAGIDEFTNNLGYADLGANYGVRPDRMRVRFANERSIITSLYTRLAIDIAQIVIKHVRVDDKDRYLEDMPSGLNNCLTVEANLDQEARAFRQDIATTLFDNGVAAIVPVDTSVNPATSDGYDIRTLRVGTIVAWYPRHVKVSLYNENKGKRQEIVLEKKFVAIIENPLYPIMNEPNSTLQRLISKLGMLDSVDEAASSGKLDLIVQLPYVIKSEARRQAAEQRRTDIEFQLKGSKYGIAYTDGTEKITQLNRPAENNLLNQIEFLTKHLFGQLGLTPEIMNGTADEQAMLNYMTRTVGPILDAISGEMKRKFLTKTGRSQGQSIIYFRNRFSLVPLADVADIADKLLRNEVLSSNEFRQLLGFAPSTDPKADQLVNSNMPQPDTGVPPATEPVADDSGDAAQSALDSVDAELSSLLADLGVSDDADLA